jgi:ribosome maturation factor RimP
MKGERDVEALVRSVVESVGLELWDVAYRREAGRMVLRVAVTREGGVDLDTITQTSEKLSRRLDLEDFGKGFQRSIGEQVRVKTVEPIEGSKVHRGALVSADAEAITIATDGGELRVPYDTVASARTVFEWGSDRS